jgi:anti-sigma-K factor RskA
MRYRNKPALQDRLAAEYVLGTLRGRARARFQAWLREDAALRRTVAQWESRLVPMAAGVAEVRPPRRVWAAIQSRVGATARVAQPGLWDSLAFWRNWGLVATGCAAALVAAIALRQPTTVEVPVVTRVEVPQKGMQQSYVALLHATAPDGQKLAYVAYAARDSDELWVKKVALGDAPPDQGYELWGLPATPGAPPKSLGMLPRDEKGTIKLAAAADQSLKDFPALAISIEPAGGSKTGLPTGPVVAKGDCLRFW